MCLFSGLRIELYSHQLCIKIKALNNLLYIKLLTVVIITYLYFCKDKANAKTKGNGVNKKN